VCHEGGYENPFPPELFEDYVGRLERPNPAARWDSPMIHLRFDEDLPFEDLAKTVLEGKKPRDPVSTKPEQAFDANFIYELDKTCQELINFIMTKQSEVTQGDVLAGLPGCPSKTRYKVMKLLSPVELKKFKKDFLSLCKLHPPKSKDRFGEAFLEFLNAQVQEAA
jgi:tRNA uridine 5-carbamoylmethylation protein Kti12